MLVAINCVESLYEDQLKSTSHIVAPKCRVMVSVLFLRPVLLVQAFNTIHGALSGEKKLTSPFTVSSYYSRLSTVIKSIVWLSPILLRYAQ